MSIAAGMRDAGKQIEDRERSNPEMWGAQAESETHRVHLELDQPLGSTNRLTCMIVSTGFEELRGEVSLLRRAIEGLSAERGDQPDYQPTLEALAASNEQIRVWARKVNELPALKLSPQQIGEDIEAAASRFRQVDRQELAAEHARLADTIAELRAISRQAHTASEQVRREKIVASGWFLGGFMLWPLLAQIEAVWR